MRYFNPLCACRRKKVPVSCGVFFRLAGKFFVAVLRQLVHKHMRHAVKLLHCREKTGMLPRAVAKV